MKTSRSENRAVQPRNLIRFDWAMKRLLRNKANYTVVEGFLSELLGEDVTILNISDSESNQDSVENKFNRVDILVENTKRELFIIEMQNSSEADYLLRMLYGVSRVITNYMQLGDPYRNVRKVYSINIVYFEIGHGTDYIYHGSNGFYGLHHHDLLALTARQQQYFEKATIQSLYPEYYILKVNDFDDVARDSLDEWIYYLKNNAIPDDFTAKGLSDAREILRLEALTKEEYKAYVHHIDQVLFERNALDTSRAEGKAEGLAEGEAIGLEKAVVNSRQKGFSVEQIQGITDLLPDQIREILKRHGLDT
ncbi:MAG: Rpn family recombination-promoting nuclease/putative transposase [Tannerella sp.]|nr:Rpn family recombination-promoting nuclease/putative transposase [Tannerella sp.]